MLKSPYFSWAARNGKLVKFDELTVHTACLSMRYALSAFEGVRGYLQADGKTLRFFALREHLRRLGATLEIIRLLAPSIDDLVQTAEELARVNQVQEDCYLRISVNAVSLGTLKDGGDEIAHDLILQPMGRKPWTTDGGGLSVAISRLKKPGDHVFPQRAKVISNYAGPRIAYLKAKDTGHDDVIMLTEDGLLSESPTANFFLVHNGRVVTPRCCDSILPGVTRRHVLKLCRQMGISAEEAALQPEDAYSADEAFLTGTGLELAPIESVDGRKMRGPREILPKIRDAYFAMVRNLPEDGEVP
jgi:branched-chain amino acid aminotransferase